MAKEWDLESINLLKDAWPRVTKQELLDMLPNRTWIAIMTKAIRLGVHRRNVWSTEELITLRQYYNTTSVSKLAQMLPGRTKQAIIVKAHELGIGHKRQHGTHKWSNQEIEKLINLWPKAFPSELLQAFPNCTYKSIRAKAVQLGLYKKLIENGKRRCNKCLMVLQLRDFKNRQICRYCFNADERKKYYNNKEYENIRKNNQRLKLKQEIFNHYGNKCVCCGESELEMLAMDHIYNDGSMHRKKITGGGGDKTYIWIRDNNFPVGFQVLCHNCNWSKYINKGECMHQIRKRSNCE